MKNTPSAVLQSAALLAIGLALPVSLHAFAEVARGSLTATTTARLAYDTNLLGNATEQDDAVFTLAPRLLYRRAVGLGTIDASLGLGINRYFDFTEFDSEDISASVRIGLPTPEGARQNGSVYGSYTDQSSIDETVGDRIRSKSWVGGFSGTYRAGTRTDLRASFNFSDTSRDKYSDRTQWTAGAGFDYHEFLGGFGLDGDYRYTDTESTGIGTVPSLNQTLHRVSTGLFYDFASGLRASADVGYRWLKRDRTETASGQTSENSYTFGLRLNGPFLPPSRFPKLESSFSIGLEKGETFGVNDRGSTHLVGRLSLAWQARERTSLSLSASRSQGLSADNFSSLDSVIRFGVTQQIGLRTRLTASLAQEWSSFAGTGRSDRRTRAQLAGSYALNKNWQAGADYSYTLSNSSIDRLDYDRHLVSGFIAYTF